MNGLNLNLRSHTETCYHLFKSKLSKVKLHSMRRTDHQNGTPSEARRPSLVYIYDTIHTHPIPVPNSNWKTTPKSEYWDEPLWFVERLATLVFSHYLMITSNLERLMTQLNMFLFLKECLFVILPENK